MDNDKSFAAFALLLVLGVAVMVTAGVMVLGDGTWPAPLSIVEHVGLGLLMRAGYKQLGGWNPADWSFAGDSAADAARALPAGSAIDEG